MSPKPSASQIREINDTIRYTMWSVFTVSSPLPDATGPRSRPRSRRCSRSWSRRTSSSAASTTSPGCGPTPTSWSGGTPRTIETLQDAYHRLRRTALGRRLDAGLVAGGAAPPGRVQQEPHPGVPGRRGAARATSASTRSCAPTSGTCCADERAPRHARRARQDGARTTRTCGPTPSPSFALGDYEWMLAFEADELHRIVDLMRDLRGLRGPAARARGGAVLHRPPGHRRRPGRRPALTRGRWAAGDRRHRGSHAAEALMRDNSTVDDVPVATGGHVVLPTADAEPYASLRRRRLPSRAVRPRAAAAPGGAAVGVGRLGVWPGRPDPVQQIMDVARGPARTGWSRSGSAGWSPRRTGSCAAPPW